MQDSDPALIVSNCIFGDGAAAVVLEPSNNTGYLTIRDFATGIYSKYREQLRYRTMPDGRLRNVLSKRVPVIGSKVIQEATERLLQPYELTIEDIPWWAVHAGGVAVLDQVQSRIDLPEGILQFSYDTFSNYGNMSSPTLPYPSLCVTF